jgi:tetratricopeptide (TPR) repeat protein
MFMLNLGEAWAADGDFVAAEKAYEQAASLWTSSYGPEHYMTVAAVEHVGAAKLAQGDLDGALQPFSRALAIRERQDPKSVATSAGGLGRVYLAKGRTDQALPLLERSVALGGGDRDDLLGVAKNYYFLAQAVLLKRKDQARARALSRQALESLESYPGAAAKLREEIRAWRSRAKLD